MSHTPSPAPAPTHGGPTHIEARAEPPGELDQVLLEGFARDLIGQASRLDDLAKQLITLQIALSGLYAAVLKLAAGGQGVTHGPWLLLAFAAWMPALGLCFLSLLPVRREVDPDDLRQVQDYFRHSAKRKLVLLSSACLCAFCGIALAVVGSLV